MAFLAGAIRAQDTPAQAAARAALMQKMAELNAQQATNAAAPPPAMGWSTPSTTVEQPAQPTNKPTEAPPATPASASDNSEFFSPVPPASSPKAMPPAKAATTAPTSNSEFFSAVPPPSNPKVLVNGSAVSQPAAPGTNSVPPSAYIPAAPETTTSASVNNAAKELGLPPIMAPPVPVTPEQDAQLHTLLDQYIANEISPEQYQAARKKILAEH